MSKLAALVLCMSLASGCFPGRGYYRGRGFFVRPWVGAALVGAAIVGTAVAVSAADAYRYAPDRCRYRTWYNGHWAYYCGDRWAYYEGGVWYAYPPGPPPSDSAPPPQVPPEAQSAPTPPTPPAPPPIQ